MASYNVLKSDGTTLATVADGTINSTASSIKFIGRTIVDYGQDIAENQLHIMENFANTTQPSNPVSGQLWWDTNINVLKVFDGSDFDQTILQNIVEDLTPQLGGNLDSNGFKITVDGSVVLSFASSGEEAENWVDIEHSQTGFGPIIRSVGSDTDIDLNISAKGAGIVNLGSGGVKLNAPLDVNSQVFTNVNSFSINNEVVLSFTSGAEEGVNWVDIITAELSQGPVIRSVGAASNIDLNISAKGTGVVNLGSGGVKLNAPLDVNNQAFTNVGPFSFGNGVVLSFASGGEVGANWVDVVWAETGSGPTIRSVGGDTDVDLNISAKGAGIVNLGSGGVRLNANLDANGNTIITDGNTVLSFASSGENAVNWVDIVHATTGSGPVIRSVGADTNVDLVFDTKGTGDINVSSNRIINLGAPFSSEDAATKDYVDDNIGFDLGEFTVAGLPTASSNANGWALATDASGGRTVVRSDGTDWKVVAVEGATVTAV